MYVLDLTHGREWASGRWKTVTELEVAVAGCRAKFFTAAAACACESLWQASAVEQYLKFHMDGKIYRYHELYLHCLYVQALPPHAPPYAFVDWNRSDSQRLIRMLGYQ